MDKEDKANQYLLHCAGFYMMLAWMEKQSEIGTGSKMANQTIYLSSLGSQYFALGVANKKKAKFPFLAIQPNESEWMRLMSWDSVVLRERDNYLYLISSIIKGDQIEYPDIPSFAIAIHFDDISKLDLLKNYQKLDAREFFVDSDSAVRVNYHNKIFNLPIKRLGYYEPYLHNNNLTHYSELLSNKEKTLQAIYQDGPPEYKGDKMTSSTDPFIQQFYDKVEKKEL